MTTINDLQNYFVQHHAEMRRLAHFHFRRLEPDQRQEAIQNTLALAWKFLYALFEQGRLHHPKTWNGVLWYAIQQTRCGRKPQGKMRSQDAYECRRRGRVKFEFVDLQDLIGRRTAVIDQVIFKVDVQRFVSTLTPRQQMLTYELASGERTKDVAQKHGVTPGAVSQFRAKFKKLYDEFFAE